jgi:hypothetical protein
MKAPEDLHLGGNPQPYSLDKLSSSIFIGKSTLEKTFIENSKFSNTYI